jgi:HAD superfamily phosphatase (TIGR01668 family)
MLRRLFPREYRPSVFHIDYESLFNNGIKNLIFDIDNTLVTYNVLVPTDEVTGLFANLGKLGFSICILSNNSAKRVGNFCEPLAVRYVNSAGKPGVSGARKAIKMLGAVPENTAIIGDQIFTDVWCGNRLGAYTILVEPVSRERDELITRVKRGIEAFVVGKYLKG